MSQIHVRLIGLGDKDTGKKNLTVSVHPGETVKSLWDAIKRDAQTDQILAAIETQNILVHVNGRAIHLLKRWDTVLEDEDKVVYMRMAFGG